MPVATADIAPTHMSDRYPEHFNRVITPTTSQVIIRGLAVCA